jgi:MFS family permease
VGLLMSISPIILVIMAPIGGSLADRFGARPVSALALLLLLLGYGLMTTLSTHTTALGYLLRFLPVALGMGLFQTPNNSAIMGSVSKSRSGVAGGLLALTRTLGSTIGIAVLGTVWAVQVMSRSAGISDATSALPAVQVALDSIFRVMQALILLSLLVTIWHLIHKHFANSSKSSTPAD